MYKQKLSNFFKDKYNVTTTIMQALAVFFLLLSLWISLFNILFLACEGVCFVIWGIKNIRASKKQKNNQSLYDNLPYSTQQIEMLKNKNRATIRNNKFIGITLIIIGVILLTTIFSIIF